MFDTEKDDITKLCEVLAPIEAKWDCFATQLGILPDKTSTIGRKNQYDPTLCLKDVLDTWLNGGYNIQKHGHQSLRRLCEATATKKISPIKTRANRLGNSTVYYIAMVY